MNHLTNEQPYIHINWTRYSRRVLAKEHCPNCKRKTFFVSFFQDWYGWDSTCLKCGDSWQDGEMSERPFLRGWRKKSIEQAKKTWRKYKPYPSEYRDNDK